MKLIAKWKPDEEPAYDEPSTVVWSDGTPATTDDYRAHCLDTHSLEEGNAAGWNATCFLTLLARSHMTSTPRTGW
jgi:hypothetical protein